MVNVQFNASISLTGIYVLVMITIICHRQLSSYMCNFIVFNKFFLYEGRVLIRSLCCDPHQLYHTRNDPQLSHRSLPKGIYFCCCISLVYVMQLVSGDVCRHIIIFTMNVISIDEIIRECDITLRPPRNFCACSVKRIRHNFKCVAKLTGQHLICMFYVQFQSFCYLYSLKLASYQHVSIKIHFQVATSCLHFNYVYELVSK